LSFKNMSLSVVIKNALGKCKEVKFLQDSRRKMRQYWTDQSLD